MTTTTADRSNHHAADFLHHDSPTVWSALAEDTSLPVYVVDTGGTIEFANHAAARAFGGDPHGKHLSEFHPEPFVRERLDHISEAIQQNRPLTVDALTQGRLMRSTIRPIASNGHPKRRALVVSRPAVEPEPKAVRAKNDDPGPLKTLTAREVEILKYIGRGYSTAEIAKALDRSVKTVEWHRVSLGEKLGVNNRVELARIAIGAGLVGLDDSPQPKDGSKPAAPKPADSPKADAARPETTKPLAARPIR